ncbi:OmpA family protein [Novosphingobium sp. FSW06-99]|uniref:OmpA family protein n=1 Tax=Novosphingobium sp. FSW06-99 TaxID=1739113 RepID=UPI00076C515B|nr:OmpA family protein [Novosphingobium sp. FSW06-99]KUR74184.1 cell envelope biogenesis protein OmpA [Novosphingobium sp. FSW06-99]
MLVISRKTGVFVLLAMTAMPLSVQAQTQDQAQPQEPAKTDITVTGTPVPDASQMSPGPEIKGFISARTASTVQVTAADGTKSMIAFDDHTRIRASHGLFGGTNLDADSLLNGLPVTVKTLQGPGGLLASQIRFSNGDLKMANMIRRGTDQRFAEQSAATEALRGRVADIDKYNIKSTTNVHFSTGKAVLTPEDKADLCTTASQAEGIDNALILVVGYTDATGSDDFNQTLSEKRANSVINYLQQVCHWKPYRMLTPTGMAKADPLASNDTPEGKAQNRRVSVNILVSKGLDGV